jgi:hypothetical protein
MLEAPSLLFPELSASVNWPASTTWARYWFGRPPKKGEKIAEQFASGVVARDGGIEDVSVADFPDDFDGLFAPKKAEDRRLNGGVGRRFASGKAS